MALLRRDETNGAVAMFHVVPVHKRAHPLARGQHSLECTGGVLGPVFQRPEERLRVRVVVAHRRAAERRHHPQSLQRGEHGSALHRTAVVRVQHHLAGCDALAQADLTHHLAGQLAAFVFIDLPAHNLAAEDVEEQVQVKVVPRDQRGQVRDVPAEQLVGRRGAQRARFAARLAGPLLDIYSRPYDAKYPVVCMDETPRQLIRETREPIAAAPGRPERHDYEYERCGVCNVFMASEPLAGRRLTKVTERRTKADWAVFLQDIAASYLDAERITLVMDNLNTHTPGSLYEAFPPEQAKALWDRFEFVYTPKHGSWLNMAEIEINVMVGQCLSRRIDSIETVRSEVAAWQSRRDNLQAKVNWQFTTKDARVKLKRLYPTTTS